MQGSVKFVSISNRGGYPMEYGRHLGCTTKAVLQKAIGRYGSVDEIPGMVSWISSERTVQKRSPLTACPSTLRQEHLAPDLAPKVKQALELIAAGDSLPADLADLKLEEAPKPTKEKKAKAKAQPEGGKDEDGAAPMAKKAKPSLDVENEVENVD